MRYLGGIYQVILFQLNVPISDLGGSYLIEQHRQANQNDKSENPEPPRSPKGRHYSQGDGNSLFIPDTIIVAPFDPEGIMTGSQSSVGERALITNMVPFIFESLHFNRIAIFVWRHKV